MSLEENYLLHYADGVMDVYTPISNTMMCWRKEESGCDVELLGVPCSVHDSTPGSVAIISIAALPDPVDLPECFLDVLWKWGNTWMWDFLHLIGDDKWLMDAIQDSTCIAVTDGSYIRELYTNMCLCAFVLEFTRGEFLASFPCNQYEHVHVGVNC